MDLGPDLEEFLCFVYNTDAFKGIRIIRSTSSVSATLIDNKFLKVVDGNDK